MVISTKKTTAKAAVSKKTESVKTSVKKTAVVKSLTPRTVKKTALKVAKEPVEAKKTEAAKSSVSKTVKKAALSTGTPATKTTASKKSEEPIPKNTTAKKTSAAKPAVKKVVAKKAVTKKTVTEKSVETAPKKTTEKKKAVAKSVAPKAVEKKVAVKKTVAKKTVGKKTAVKKTGASKAVVKKVAVQKSAALKTDPAKTASVKPAVKKTVAPKSAVKKTVSVSKKPEELILSASAPAVEKVLPKTTTARKAAVPKAALKKATSRKTGGPVEVLDVEKPPVSVDNPQVEVESKKFDVSRDCEILYPTPPAGYGLPDFYDETYVRLLVRDPEWVFVYWEIDAKTRDRFWIPRGAHQGRLMLRWHDVTDVPDFDGQNAQRVIETAIDDQTSSWYQHLPDPGRYWCAELGVLSSEGEFLCICRSNVVQTPRVTLATPREYERWMRVGWLFAEREIFEAPAGQAPPEAQEVGAKRKKRVGIMTQKAWQPGAPDEPESGTEETVARLVDQPLGRSSSESLMSSFGFVSSSQVMRPDLAQQLEDLKKTRKK